MDETTDDTGTVLDRIQPSTVLDLYLAERETDLAESTRRSHRYVLEQFVSWCEENDLTAVADLDGRALHEFRIERRDDVSGNTLRTQLGVLRHYIRFAESIEAAPTGLAERLVMPQAERKSRNGRLAAETAGVVLDHLRDFQYASRDHAVLRVLWVTAIRVGTARALDVDDLDREVRTLAVRHRPETDTPLKNKDRAERLLALDARTSEALADYVDHRRHDVTDEHGREPLFTTECGRMGVSTIRRAVYRWTRPCQRGNGCPHDRDPDECDAKRTVTLAAQCPSTVSPHEVRRGSISEYLADGTPPRAISDRADVSEEVLDAHYDARTEREKTAPNTLVGAQVEYELIEDLLVRPPVGLPLVDARLDLHAHVLRPHVRDRAVVSDPPVEISRSTKCSGIRSVHPLPACHGDTSVVLDGHLLARVRELDPGARPVRPGGVRSNSASSASGSTLECSDGRSVGCTLSASETVSGTATMGDVCAQSQPV